MLDMPSTLVTILQANPSASLCFSAKVWAWELRESGDIVAAGETLEGLAQVSLLPYRACLSSWHQSQIDLLTDPNSENFALDTPARRRSRICELQAKIDGLRQLPGIH